MVCTVFLIHLGLSVISANKPPPPQVLPTGTIVKSVYSHGVSAWSFTCKIEIEDETGKAAAYFAKVFTNGLPSHQTLHNCAKARRGCRHKVV